MKNVLISSLGQSPGVVTGTVDALKFFDGVDIHRVITISTSDSTILNYAVDKILTPEFENIDIYSWGIKYKNYHISKDDINNPEDNQEFLENFACHLHSNLMSEEADGIYVSLAGGRKTMASLVFIGVKLILDAYSDNPIYKAKFKDLTHIIVDDKDIERRGITEKLIEIKNDDSDLYKKCLHPIQAFGEKAKEKVHLIRLSGMFTKADDLEKIYENIRNNDLSKARGILVN
jgi:CRISPR-associated protein (TIGR02584 family)